MKTNYYFKFEVQDHIAHEHRTFKQAIRTARRIKQNTIYLVLYITPNSYHEPFNEVEITNFNLSAQEVEQLKNDLLNNSKKYF